MRSPPISSSGRRPSRTSHRPSAMIAPSTTGGHDELDEEQPVERRIDVRERGREDEHRRSSSAIDARTRYCTAALLARNREVAHRLAIPGLPRRRRRPCRASPATGRSRRGPSRREGWRSPSPRRANAPGRTSREARTGSRRRGRGGAGCGPSRRACCRCGRAGTSAATSTSRRRRRGGPTDRERDDRQQEPRTQRQALAHGYDASSM